MGKKKVSGNARRKEKEMREYVSVNGEAFLEARSSSPLWNGLVLHHKDVFVSHVLPKLNRTDRLFFSKVNLESWSVLEYARVDASELSVVVHECTSISTLEWAWNDMDWGSEDRQRNCDRSSLVLLSKLLERTNSSSSSGREK